MSKKLFDLQNKNVLLTGASKGMGLAMAEGLVNHGANVVISSRKLDQCEKAAKSINESIGKEKAFAYACNASSKDELNALVEFSKSSALFAAQSSQPAFLESSSDQTFSQTAS